MESELGRLVLQVVGVIITTIAIGLLVPFTDSPKGSDDD
jgi:hypothetical protein